MTSRPPPVANDYDEEDSDSTPTAGAWPVSPPPPPPPGGLADGRRREGDGQAGAAGAAPVLLSRSERTHLLCRVELQREKAAARGVGRLQAGRGRGLASAGSVKSRSDSGSSCPDSSAIAGPTAAPRGFPAESEDGRGGGGSCCDDSGYGGGGGNAVTVSPSRRCCVEGRLEVRAPGAQQHGGGGVQMWRLLCFTKFLFPVSLLHVSKSPLFAVTLCLLFSDSICCCCFRPWFLFHAT